MVTLNANDKYFVLVKDIIKQSEYIYNDIPIDYNSISKTFLSCCNELKNNIMDTEKENIIITKNETYCEIIKEFNNKKQGYLWNVDKVEKNVLFLVSLIKTQSNYLEKSITQLVTELMNVRINTINESIKFIHEKINKLEKKIDIPSNSIIEIPQIILNDDNTDLLGYKYEQSTYMKKDIFKNNPSPLIDLSDNYLIELKEKLALPNYGLNTDHIKFD